MTSQYDLVIVNGKVVTDTDIGYLDIAVKDGRISKVIPRGELLGVTAQRTIDAQGGLVMVSCSMSEYVN